MILNKRRIRSFVQRAGHFSSNSQDCFDSLWPKYGLTLDSKLEAKQVFGRVAPLNLEIGFGNGEALLKLAQEHPDQDFIGIEVYRLGVVKVLRSIAENNIKNVRLYQADAIEVLQFAILDQSLARVMLLFPDPWPKTKHHKRRIVQPEFIGIITKKLQSNGILHMATDWQDYYRHMLAVMEQQSILKRLTLDEPQRPITKFERRGIKLGYEINDLIFFKPAIF